MRPLVALNIVVAVALAVFFVNSFDFSSAFNGVDWLWIPVAIAFYLLLNVVSAWRLRWLAEKFSGKHVSFSRAFWLHMGGMALSDYTPGRAGYVLVALKAQDLGLQQKRVGGRVLGISLASDFLVRGFLAVAAALLLVSELHSQEVLYAGAFLFLLSVAVLWACWRRSVFVTKILRLLPSGGRLSSAYETVFEKGVAKRVLAKSVLMSAAGAVVRGAEWMLLAKALGIAEISVGSLFLFTAFNAVITALSFVPLSVAGIGLQEGFGAILFAAALKTPMASAAALMILVRVLESGTDLIGLRLFLPSRTPR
ncbi:Lysylphosphatidylglycerol synthase TM region [Candidatus Norongarragalina meridionalis]|nr:Lysylphosphatidylglycerol synthase TM region [Candidatus Norongarragalina meridionalis]